MNNNEHILSQLETAIALLKSPTAIHAIEKDIILEKLRLSYQAVLEIDITSSESIEHAVTSKAPEAIVEIPKPTIEPKIIKEPESRVAEIADSVFEIVKPETVIVEPEKKSPTKSDDLLIRIDETPVKKEEPIVQKSIFDKPQDSLETVKETPEIKEVAPQVFEMNIPKAAPSVQKESLAAKLSHAKVSNLMTAMSFSDKLLFQRQLFKNNADELNQTIEAINNLQSFDEAIEWIHARYTWDFNNQFVIKFIELIQRRF